ncbi:efflux transporter outer membrane subunit [Enterovirga rhinocerotis]|uniref:NodT family efflux transporter outer membrane factor (OMF) lipoprotein n=1 Tax=Enterovirga rhinocerotis TaxID=1339210 RepID=A0A4R7BP17_9HYPH|nr:efflux transporter outer membrane subunit [Enterovirga rhinocerotis]TDR87274.1 NodT family efflux transporter outer membrane factor (OMF) lipoprotein [Enterovirga rhinocerotis]
MPNSRLPSPSRYRIPFIAASALALASCQIVPPDTALPIPTAFRAGGGGAPAPAPRPDWATGFGSAELNRLVAVAMAQNFDVEAAIARINQAEAQAVIASSALFPFLGGTGDGSRVQTATRAGPVISNRVGLGLTASYELDLFGKNRFAARAADDSARASRFDRDTVALATMAAVANTYFDVLSAQDRLRIAQENLRIAQRVLDAVRSRLGAGTGTALDTAQQESVVATQRARIPPLVQAVQQNRNTLAVLMGRTPESVAIKGGSLNALRIPSPRPGLPSALLLRRPDIGLAEASLASAEASVASARAAFFPTIQLTGSGGFQSVALRSLLGPNTAIYSAAAGLTQPIFDGAALKGRLDFERGRTAELAAAYKKAIVQSLADVENALIAVRQTAELEARQRDAVAASRRALDITETQLRAGTIDTVTLFTVQTTLFNAQDALAQARLLRFNAAVSLFQALGGGFTQSRAQPVATGVAPLVMPVGSEAP